MISYIANFTIFTIYSKTTLFLPIFGPKTEPKSHMSTKQVPLKVSEVVCNIIHLL